MVYGQERKMRRESTAGIEKLRRRNLVATFAATFWRGKPLPSKGSRNFATSQSIGGKIIIIYRGAIARPSRLLVGLKSGKLRGALYSFISVKNKLRPKWSFKKVENHNMSKNKWSGEGPIVTDKPLMKLTQASKWMHQISPLNERDAINMEKLL